MLAPAKLRRGSGRLPAAEAPPAVPEEATAAAATADDADPGAGAVAEAAPEAEPQHAKRTSLNDVEDYKHPAVRILPRLRCTASATDGSHAAAHRPLLPAAPAHALVHPSSTCSWLLPGATAAEPKNAVALAGSDARCEVFMRFSCAGRRWWWRSMRRCHPRAPSSTPPATSPSPRATAGATAAASAPFCAALATDGCAKARVPALPLPTLSTPPQTCKACHRPAMHPMLRCARSLEWRLLVAKLYTAVCVWKMRVPSD